MIARLTLSCLACISMATGAAFLIGATYTWLATLISNVGAALVVGGTLVLLGAIIALVLTRPIPQANHAARSPSVDDMSAVASLLRTGLQAPEIELALSLFKRKPLLATLAVAALGLTYGIERAPRS